MLTALDLTNMNKIAPFRNTKLFKEFLPKGYEITTLNSVLDKNAVVELKVVLGTLITLYDDFADRPDHFNPKLLAHLYQVPFQSDNAIDSTLNPSERQCLDLARSLFSRLFAKIKMLVHHGQLIEIFFFDLKQFLLSNQYCEQLTQNPHLANQLENRMYLHHNMGIVMAGMIDLMASPNFDMSELGQARSLFLLGQRVGRISNVLTTYERERNESDITNELHLAADKGELKQRLDLLKVEMGTLLQKMGSFRSIKSFSALEYRAGLTLLHSMHIQMKGII